MFNTWSWARDGWYRLLAAAVATDVARAYDRAMAALSELAAYAARKNTLHTPLTLASLVMSQFPILRVVDSSSNANISRRGFLRAAGAATALAAAMPSQVITAAEPGIIKPTSESFVRLLYDSLTAEQKKQVCFNWSYAAEPLGLLRTYISANWHVTKPVIDSDFYTADQQKLIRNIFLGLIQPEWVRGSTGN